MSHVSEERQIVPRLETLRNFIEFRRQLIVEVHQLAEYQTWNNFICKLRFIIIKKDNKTSDKTPIRWMHASIFDTEIDCDEQNGEI